MRTRSFFSVALLLSAGVLAAGQAAAAMYRCEGNLVTDSPNGGKNCVAVGSRLKSPTFSAGSVDATIEAEPTGAGPPGAHRPHARTPGRKTDAGALVPAPSRKP